MIIVSSTCRLRSNLGVLRTIVLSTCRFVHVTHDGIAVSCVVDAKQLRAACLKIYLAVALHILQIMSIEAWFGYTIRSLMVDEALGSLPSHRLVRSKPSTNLRPGFVFDSRQWKNSSTHQHIVHRARPCQRFGPCQGFLDETHSEGGDFRSLARVSRRNPWWGGDFRLLAGVRVGVKPATG